MLISFGAYYLSLLLVSLFSPAYWKITNGIVYSGDFAGMVVMPIVNKLPIALAAAIVGAVVVRFVDSDGRIFWPMLPALLYAVFGFLGFHWARSPVHADRVYQTIASLFPAITCIMGGIISAWQSKTPLAAEKTPI
ncbi:MAG TPA: hypothetical protein VK709_16465 [Candidatus Saccharimonadales bacterium]|nr:hypothetical protein [Candidatus Saccharimonadales bacterium]